MINIAVIIPYYQVSVGVLTRALASVVRQKATDISIKIIIVDDQSPLSVADELAATGFSLRGEWEVITRTNGGPGAARNSALNHLSSDSPDFIAFLDSDDEWLPDHLERALCVMGDAVDFYGSDHLRIKEQKTFFEAHQEARESMERFGERRYVNDAAVFDLEGSKAILAFVDNYLVQTSTVVCRWSALGNVRFDASLRSAGEDHLFWLDSAASARRISIDLRLGSRCLEGVNIYEAATGWDGEAAIKRAFYLLMLWYRARARFTADEQVVQAINVRLKNHRRFFAYLWFRALARRQDTNIPLLGSLALVDGMALPRLAGDLCVVAVDRWKKGAFDFVEH